MNMMKKSRLLQELRRQLISKQGVIDELETGLGAAKASNDNGSRLTRVQLEVKQASWKQYHDVSFKSKSAVNSKTCSKLWLNMLCI
ncbi:hypothetical protein Scep_024941 [Stephania cephalantha]|uniref:Uncharacterized protein n=1 Tax=Stephania cephalantha TaxID=152367 RepID=A0AAP0EXG7_9MAGN